MKSFHVICGLPRSGSTLLCNVLNQNSEVYASSTSSLPFLLSSVVNLVSNSPEIKSDLINNRSFAEQRVQLLLKTMVETWYKDKPHVFDKGRLWGSSSLLLRNLFPNSLIICLVRDLRNIFASVEKTHMQHPFFDLAADPPQKTIYGRADEMFSPNGLIGSTILSVEDLIRRNPENLMIVRYEDFVVSPDKYIKEIYLRIRLNYFKHNYNDIKNTAEDVDGLYLNKFPHVGEGKITVFDLHEWRRYLSEDLATLIMERYPFYNSTFKYYT